MSKEQDQATELENKDESEENTEASLYDAVSSAIDEVTPQESPDEDDDDNAGDDSTDSDDESDVSASGDDATADEADDAEESEEGSETDEDEPADDGETDETESGDATEGKDDKDGTESEEGDDSTEESDPINDPIPESTNEKTKARIESLIGIIKEKDAAESQRDEIVDIITSTGADADQYAATLGFLKLYNSTNTEERKQALGIARGLVKELALELNEGATVVNLDDHADLLAEIEAGTLTEARAKEIAANRDAETLRTAKQQAATTKQETESQTKANVRKGVQQLDEFETAMRANPDENYNDIRPAFISILRPVLKRTHPSEWGATARDIYSQVKTMRPAQPRAKPAPKNRPLRPKGSGGAGSSSKATEASTALEALDSALETLE